MHVARWLLLTGIVGGIFAPVRAQVTTTSTRDSSNASIAPLRRPVTLAMHDVAVVAAIQAIDQQANLRLSYTDRLPHLDKHILDRRDEHAGGRCAGEGARRHGDRDSRDGQGAHHARAASAARGDRAVAGHDPGRVVGSRDGFGDVEAAAGRDHHRDGDEALGDLQRQRLLLGEPGAGRAGDDHHAHDRLSPDHARDRGGIRTADTGGFQALDGGEPAAGGHHHGNGTAAAHSSSETTSPLSTRRPLSPRSPFRA